LTVKIVSTGMKKYIVLLRGINVGGHKKIKMTDLRAMFETMGCLNVQTYIQSGNVILEQKALSNSELEGQIKTQIKEIFNYDVPVLVLTTDELQHIFDTNPFLTEIQEDITKLHVTLLSQIPDNEHINAIKDIQYKADEFQIIDKNIFLFCPDGYGRTKFTNNFFENKLKVQATTRNWKTIGKLIAMTEND